MTTDILRAIQSNLNDFYSFFNFVSQKDKKLCVTGDLLDYCSEFSAKHKKTCNEELKKIICAIQESVTVGDSIYIEYRGKISMTRFYSVNLSDKSTEKISAKDYLMVKEQFINPRSNNNMLSLDFKPFYATSPLVKDPKSIGRGVEYLNRYLSSQLFNDTTKWKVLLFNFLHLHRHNGHQLILNDRIKDYEQLGESLDKAVKFLKNEEPEAQYKKVKHKLQDFGFEAGLGKNVEEIIKSLNLLDDVLNSPDHNVLAQFISRIPMVFRIAIISPHGFFSQSSPLGMPDTGGQIVYILDQVRALEKELIESLRKTGLNILPKIVILTRLIPNPQGTDCNKRLEKIHHTKNTWILRVPFREHNKKVTDNWISRFEIWPYLEEFAEDSYISLLAELGGRPDLIIGNYSDGNLVSYLLSKKFKVTQCCIAHALEKSKYLYSGLYWKDLEPHYHFSLQFSADLIAINSANFLITSSYQEIAGTDTEMGQYESYRYFTMPDLYRVVDGMNARHTKFNIVSPGVNEDVHFPPNEEDKRIPELKDSLTELLLENQDHPKALGSFKDTDKRIIFAMSRLDKIKNLSGLVRWYGESKELQEKANLLICAGKIDAEESDDNEEKEQINLLHNYVHKYNLIDNFRWIGRPLRKDEAGEAFRLITEKEGVFVQPALFEGFGLTVIEAMVTGLPVFATKYGGPSEIIEHGKNGFHINPAHDDESTEVILNFFRKVEQNPDYWKEISENAMKRVEEKYNWKLYSKRLLSQAKIYGFWKYSTDMENRGMEAYLDLFYHTVYRPRAKQLLEEHNTRQG